MKLSRCLLIKYFVCKLVFKFVLFDLFVLFKISIFPQLHHCVCVLLQNELVFTDIIRLSVNGAVSEGPEGAQQPIIGKECTHTIFNSYN